MALGFAAVATVVTWAHGHGLTTVLAHLAGSGGSFAALLRVGAVGAGAANVVNNLPAYLALEPAASSSAARLMSLLVGVDVGPLLTPWASLATLLWLQRCRAAGVRVPPFNLAAAGLGCAAVSVVAAVGALALTG